MSAWLWLVGAGLLEIGWAIGLKHTDGWTRPLPSALAVAAAVISFLMLAHALKTLPVGTAYAVWVGIGTVGVAAVGIVLLGESASTARLLFLALILVGIAGLKFVES
ncbi:multidrug transporter : Small multidrug resistance protein OS=Serratia plymuthica PRI-2C GN=Q5A_16376 PE=3 SV=1: Multi_Drug_Res [Gemmata massiliana]|uniref:Guanidinium exporter n=1 Tax=Gemmata massiliana TaxID=1210884 RepID=A0A6P2D3C3_9BACT|nr:multidrug efflux SMR transporter [Gemmata massiliana]VTR95593.1 multidrug transporter : Small multidrug resistance protein OS=Serratia plymuthica PRI-2C GN=Q5A_16376 PE=3 SV=1: Multi_Drug_Res [Gemmata massiliana]